MTGPVVTRFAPSPTGYLHIGGARTALFNWLYAKHCGGKMLLRIEDTDRERSTDAAIAAIIDGLSWLGIDWEGAPYYQFARADRHREIAEKLLAEGKAYRAYETPEELNEMRAMARAEGRFPRYDGTWRDRDSSEIPQGTPSVVRIKSPLEGETVIEDRVQGRVSFPNSDLDDFIILRSDGTPTYMLAVVVDDYDMGVTHIIRGDDHLTNAGRQKILFDALDWPLPVMAHIPLIHGSDGAKLSKRHGALGVDAYRAMGYLPEAIRNYLVRLAWSHGDDEIMSTEQMIAWFEVDDVNRGAARFDFAKLESLNAHYIRQKSDEALFDLLMTELPHLPGGDAFEIRLTPSHRDQLRRALPLLKERAKTLKDLLDGANFIVAERPLELDAAAMKLMDGDAMMLLSRLVPALSSVEPWSADTIEPAIKSFAEAEQLKLGKIAQPLRAALTGRTTSPGIFDVLAILGRDESLARLGDQIRL
ncbi:MAG: glutamyl-tRNA synthetase [Betaproteobacteria bacterium SG8_40]|nr:MAG: glutamyl-tRNA synthetase [Betaproteobacteria bacterium SG8_40]